MDEDIPARDDWGDKLGLPVPSMEGDEVNELPRGRLAKDSDASRLDESRIEVEGWIPDKGLIGRLPCCQRCP